MDIAHGKDLRQNPSHILRVVLYGPESTGKTTLAKALAKHYQTLTIVLSIRRSFW